MLETLYNILVKAAEQLLPYGGLLGDKMKLFSEGRKEIFAKLEKSIAPLRSYVFTPMRHGSLLLCGDAAGMITPLCGNGMAMALQSAALASDYR